MKKLSIILPCHNEERNLPLLIPEIVKNIPRKYLYEIICVDDGSTDTTAEVIRIMAKKNKNVKGLIFYKNFGHQEALRAGIEKSTGEAIVMMDADFQHPPKLIKKFILLWEKGYDLVQARKKEDQTAGLTIKIQRLIGYKIWRWVTNGTIAPGISDFRLISKRIREHFSQSQENEIFLRGLVNLVAKNPKTISYSVGKRKFGKSSYTFNMFINMFINGFISFSTAPLRVATALGIIIFLATGIFIGFDIIMAITTGRQIVEGYKTVVVLVLVIDSVLMIYLGILGEYVGTIFREVKKRPTYIVEDRINLRK